MAGPEAYDDELAIARPFLEEAFPNCLFVPAFLPTQVQHRMDIAGLGLAQVISLDDGAEQYATYITKPTRHTAALEIIWQEEQEGELTEGSHERAIDAIVSGEFDLEWAKYLPLQRGK